MFHRSYKEAYFVASSVLFTIHLSSNEMSIGLLNSWNLNFLVFPEIPVGWFPESGWNMHETQSPTTKISGKPGNLLKIPRILPPYMSVRGEYVGASTIKACSSLCLAGRWELEGRRMWSPAIPPREPAQLLFWHAAPCKLAHFSRLSSINTRPR